MSVALLVNRSVIQLGLIHPQPTGAPRHHLKEVDAHPLCRRFQIGHGPNRLALTQADAFLSPIPKP
jgi:hypothetical protein